MNARAFITTSWDDGHPLDWRVAELLDKHGLTGTFYIPRSSQRPTMPEADVRRLSERFEVGAHTLNHVGLNETDLATGCQEIADSRKWVQDITGRPCGIFCPPKGQFRAAHLPMIRDAGFDALRSVELLSVSLPRRAAGLALMPTTIQAHPHGLMAYARNLLRRGAVANAWNWIAFGRSRSWVALAQRLLNRVVRCGGVFHLWGHSWEIDASGQWAALDQALAELGAASRIARVLSNGEVCRSIIPQ